MAAIPIFKRDLLLQIVYSYTVGAPGMFMAVVFLLSEERRCRLVSLLWAPDLYKHLGLLSSGLLRSENW